MNVERTAGNLKPWDVGKQIISRLTKRELEVRWGIYANKC